MEILTSNSSDESFFVEWALVGVEYLKEELDHVF